MLDESWADPAVRVYRHEVLVGPWLSSKTLAKAKLDKFIADYKEGKTALQNTRRMKANLLREVSLALPDSWLRLGGLVQVLAPDMPAFSLAAPRGHLGVFLAATVQAETVDNCQHLTEGSHIHGTAMTEPCVRNSWRLCGEDGSSRLDGCPLRLGQCFTLRAVESGTRCPLYVRAKCGTTDQVGCGPPPLELSTECDTYCRWRALHPDKNKRPETEGGAIPANMRVVLQHAASSLNLAAAAGGKRHWKLTFFGRECQIGLKDYKDQYGQVTSENIWVLGAQRLRDPRADLPCPPPPLYPPPKQSEPPPPPPDPCPVERACGPPPPLPPPELRKTECTVDMPCQRDIKCKQLPLPAVHPAPRADLRRGDKPCPRDPTCPQDRTCDSRPPCPPCTPCLRETLRDNSMWRSWQKIT